MRGQLLVVVVLLTLACGSRFTYSQLALSGIQHLYFQINTCQQQILVSMNDKYAASRGIRSNMSALNIYT